MLDRRPLEISVESGRPDGADDGYDTVFKLKSETLEWLMQIANICLVHKLCYQQTHKYIKYIKSEIKNSNPRKKKLILKIISKEII